MIELVSISGSHGDLGVDRLTGEIVERYWSCTDRGRVCDEGCVGYDNIDKFDAIDLKARPESESFDILSTGYWVGDHYEQGMDWAGPDTGWVERKQAA